MTTRPQQGWRSRRPVVAALLLLLLTFVATFSDAAAASLTLPALFSDGMVVQQGEPVQLWGWATPNDSVEINFAGQTLTAHADRDGMWRAQAKPLAPGGPYTMRVRTGGGGGGSGSGSGDERVISGILAGEVWLCSGQSNMAMSLPELADRGKDVITAADFPQIRMFRVRETPADEPWRDVAGAQWKPCTPANAPRYSAFAYFFARKLHRELKTPVGIVLSAWGGSSTVAWTSRDALDAPLIRRQVPHDVLGWGDMVRPARLSGAMLHPLVPYTIRGVAWYQGETEAAADQNPFLYRLTFPAMIEDWRQQWNKPGLPFYFVQLPTLRSGHRYPVVRESQRLTALRVPRTGMITTLDIGEPNHLHPLNKEQFADRMADLVLNHEYGRTEFAADGPRFREARVEGSKIRVRLDHADGVKTSDGQPPRAFGIAAADKKFVDAVAHIESDGSILVSSDQVSEPVAIRYAWSAEPRVNVVNAGGLPLEPFRSDDWPVDGQELMWQPLPPRASLKKSTDAATMMSSWKWGGSGTWQAEGDKQRFTKAQDGGRAQLVIRQPPKPGVATTTPTAWWETDLQSPSDHGVTGEIRLQIYRATAPLTGVEFELRRGSKKYRIAVAPTHVYAYHGNEIRILARNLDNSTDYHAYRLAVRADGVAQIYFDARELGTLAGEPTDDSANVSIGWGKRADKGDITVNIDCIAFDTEGAFQPGN